MRALLHYRASPSVLTALRAQAPPWLETVAVDEADDAATLRELAQADVLLHVLKPMTAPLFAAAPNLKLVQKIGVGVNTIDLAVAKAHGVRVANMPGTNSQAVAEMTVSLILSTLRRIPAFDAATRRGEGWTLPLDAIDATGEIHGKTVGLVGCGAVPQRLIPVLRALGARVIFTATRSHQVEGALQVSLPELLATADIVSLHVPLTPATAGLLNAEAFARMRRGAILINTARGGLVEETALFAALQRGHLRAAGLDVFNDEPAAATNPLFALPNVTVMPHLAWLTPETWARSFDIAFENCRRIREREPLLHEIPL